MVYPYMTKYNGVYYLAGENVPEEDEKIVSEKAQSKSSESVVEEKTSKRGRRKAE